MEKITQNIVLVPLGLGDAQQIFDAINTQREYLGKWLPFVESTTSVDDVQCFVNYALCNAHSEPTYTIRKSGEFIGLIGFKATDKLNRKTEIGYWLSEQFQGQGIMTKSVIALCRYAFNELEMNRVQLKCAVGNSASSAIAKRVGFTLEGVERAGEYVRESNYFDLEIYSLLKTEIE